MHAERARPGSADRYRSARLRRATRSNDDNYALLLEICIVLTTQMWASGFAFKADNFCRGRMHYKFCPSPRADALQVLSLSEGRCITSFGSL